MIATTGMFPQEADRQAVIQALSPAFNSLLYPGTLMVSPRDYLNLRSLFAEDGGWGVFASGYFDPVGQRDTILTTGVVALIYPNNPELVQVRIIRRMPDRVFVVYGGLFGYNTWPDVA